MHKIALPGISKESKDELVYTAATVRSNHVIALRPEPIPPKESKKLRRRLKASHNLHLENGAVWHSSGASVSAIASWVGIVQITVNESCRRYRLLAFDRCGERSLFAIPIDIVDQFDTLPSTDYSAGEVKLLRLMADEVSGQEATREYYIALPHPARRDILWQRDRWCEEPDREALIEILRQRDWLIPVIAAALDVHLRSFKIFRDGPLGIYNITLSSNDLQADKNFCSVLRALNFTAAPSFMGMAVPEIFVRDKDDLRAWRGCHDRLILIRTATGSLLTPLLDEIDERERLRSCGGILPPRLPTVPIVRCKAVLNRPFVVDVVLPKGEKTLSTVEQDMLRSAMALAVNRKVAQAVYNRWRERMSAPHAYRMDGFAVWAEVISTEFLRAVFSGPSGLPSQALKLFSDSQAEQAQAEQEREQLISKAIELINTPSRFEREIADRPDSKEKARRLLDVDQKAVAFWYQPASGNNKGRQFLAFSTESLKRLIRRVGCGEELYDAVLAQAERSGILDQCNRSINLGGSTFNAITFFVEKC